MTSILAENFTWQLRPRYTYATLVFLTHFLDSASVTSYGHYPITLFPAAVPKSGKGAKGFLPSGSTPNRRLH